MIAKRGADPLFFWLARDGVVCRREERDLKSSVFGNWSSESLIMRDVVRDLLKGDEGQLVPFMVIVIGMLVHLWLLWPSVNGRNEVRNCTSIVITPFDFLVQHRFQSKKSLKKFWKMPLQIDRK